jgi:phage shock protein PspC (stress-responsive transcriptional regulator)
MSDTLDNSTLDDAPARRLVRVDEGRWLGGVAAGLGRYFDVNPLVYRIAFVALAFAGGTGILLYLAAWLVIPAEGSEDSTAVQALREHRDRPWLLLGVGLLLFGAVLVLSESDLWTGVGNIWLAALLGGAALLWWHLAHRDERPAPTPAAPAQDATTTAVARPPQPQPPPQRQRKPSLAAPVLGVLLAVAGILGLLAVLDVYDIDLDLAFAASVAIVGAAIAIGAFTGFRVGALVALGLVLLGGFAFTASLPVPLSAGIGDKVDRPLDVAVLEQSYEYGIGDYELDLTNVRLAERETHVDVSLGIGALMVTVPDDVAVEVDAHAGAGEVLVFGATDDGIGADRELSVPGAEPDSPKLVLDASVGFGQIEVRRG